MRTLVLKLAGPLQAWGTDSRLTVRHTDPHPSKSGVIGLLAAAQGRRRSDSVEDLLELRFGVRRDQPGSVTRDFQTAARLDRSHVQALTHRYYLSDAVFVAAVQGESRLIDALADSLRHPRFPLYLGRRSCPPAAPLYLTTLPGPISHVLTSTEQGVGVPWLASQWWKHKQPQRLWLDVIRDADPGELEHDRVRDVPVSFAPDHRQYSTRGIVHDRCEITNTDAPRTAANPTTAHNPFDLCEATNATHQN